MMGFVSLFMNLLIFTFAILALLLGAYCLLVLWTRYKYRHFPCPQPCSFLFGHLLVFREERRKRDELFTIFTQWAHEHGKVYVIYLLHYPWVITCDITATQDILIKENFPKAKRVYNPISTLLGTRFLGNGLITEMNNEKWSKRRQEFNAAFHRSTLKELLSDFNSVGDQFIQALGNYADTGKQIPLMAWTHRAALSIICRVGYGKDLDVFKEDSPFNDAVTVMGQAIGLVLRDPTRTLPFMDGGLAKELRTAIAFVKKEARKWHTERRAALENNEYTADDILDRTLKMEEKGDILDETDDVLDDFLTFFFAGHETTANTISFMMMEVARHPEVLRRLCEEVDEVIGQKPHISMDDLNKLDYMNLVWKETLRLWPIGAQIFREVTRDGFKINNIEIPKGTLVAPSTFISSRMPEYVPNPLEFNPDRFHPDSPEKPVTYASYPFSLGPRNCIGQNFAIFEIKVLFAKFLQNFNYKLDPTQSFDFIDTGTIRPKDMVRATLSWKKSS